MKEDYVLSLTMELLKIEGFNELEKEEQWAMAKSLLKDIQEEDREE